MRSVAQAEAELRALLHPTLPTALAPLEAVATGETEEPLRRSSVLILFGALDRVPAVVPDVGATGTTDAAEGSNGLGSPGAAGKPGLMSAAVTVPLELDVLLTRRAAGMRHHPGQIAFPGGGVEPGDTSLAATALREAREETRLDPSGVAVLGALSDVPIPVSRNLVTPIVSWWQRPSQTAADQSESVDVFRVPVAELLAPENRVTAVLEHDGHRFRGPAFQLGQQFGGGIVWGFTSMVLAALFAELGWSVPWDEQRTVQIAR